MSFTSYDDIPSHLPRGKACVPCRRRKMVRSSRILWIEITTEASHFIRNVMVICQRAINAFGFGAHMNASSVRRLSRPQRVFSSNISPACNHEFKNWNWNRMSRDISNCMIPTLPPIPPVPSHLKLQYQEKIGGTCRSRLVESLRHCA